MGFFDFLFDKQRVEITANMSDGNEYIATAKYTTRNYSKAELEEHIKDEIKRRTGLRITKVISITFERC